MDAAPNVKFGNNEHPAVKDLKRMPIRKVARIAHYFGMAIVPEPVVKEAVDGINKVQEMLPHYRALELAAKMYFDDEIRFKPTKYKGQTMDGEVVALQMMSEALDKLETIRTNTIKKAYETATKKVKRKKVKLRRKKKIR